MFNKLLTEIPAIQQYTDHELALEFLRRSRLDNPTVTYVEYYEPHPGESRSLTVSFTSERVMRMYKLELSGCNQTELKQLLKERCKTIVSETNDNGVTNLYEWSRSIVEVLNALQVESSRHYGNPIVGVFKCEHTNLKSTPNPV